MCSTEGETEGGRQDHMWPKFSWSVLFPQQWVCQAHRVPRGLKDPQDPVGDAIQKIASILRLLPIRRLVGSEEVRKKTTSCLVIFPRHLSRQRELHSHRLSSLTSFGPLSFIFLIQGQTSKATIWVLFWRQLQMSIFRCLPTWFHMFFCFSVASEFYGFASKMQASLSRVLRKKSQEAIRYADDTGFVNSSTWLAFWFLDFNFLIDLDYFLRIYICYHCLRFSFCSLEIEVFHHCCWLS